jgi:hypothetical protein
MVRTQGVWGGGEGGGLVIYTDITFINNKDENNSTNNTESNKLSQFEVAAGMAGVRVAGTGVASTQVADLSWVAGTRADTREASPG